MGKRHKSKIKLNTTFHREDYPPKPKGPVYPCARCGKKKVAALMIRDRKRGTNDKVGSWCKDCHQAYMKQYRLDHKEQIEAKYRKWVESHREQRRRSQRQIDKITKDLGSIYTRQGTSVTGPEAGMADGNI